MTLQADLGLLVAFLLALVRAAAWLAVVPGLGNRMIPARAKAGLAAGLAVAAAPRLADTQVPLETAPLVGAVAVQVAVGLALGFLAMVLFAAVQAGGELIDLFGGFTISQVYDPLSSSHSSVFGRFYHLVATVLLFAIDGHLLLVRGFLTSFEAVSVTGPALGDLSRVLLRDVQLFLVAAVEIAGPLLAAFFLADVALGLLSRAAPQMNVFAVSLPFKILLTLLLVSTTLPLLPDAVGSLVGHALRSGSALLGASG